MPIIEMKKVFLLGHNQEKDKIFDQLHNMNLVQLLDVKNGKNWDEEFESLLEPDQPGESAAEYDEQLSMIRYCLDFFQRHFPVRKNFVQQFTGAKLELSTDQYHKYIEDLEKVEEIYESCRRLEDELAGVRNEETQYTNLLTEFSPWEPLDVPLEKITDGPFTVMRLHISANDQFGYIEKRLSEILSAFHLEVVSTDNEYTYFFFICLADQYHLAQDIFKEKAVTTASFPEIKGTANENSDISRDVIAKIGDKREQILTKVEAILEQRPMLMACYDYADNEYKKLDAVSNLARTENSFLLEGWVPAPVLGDLEKRMANHTETAVVLSRDPLPREEVPVLLHNKGPADAYEVVTKLYSTPRKSELDPTPYMAPFFFVFFGICLSDAGYGLMLALIALFVMKKLKLGGMGKQLLMLLFYGGLSAIIFGALLGSYFGDLLNLPALWFNPLDDPMRMLFYCFAIGLVHIYFGMGLQAYRNIKAGQILSALFDQGFWFIFLNGLIMLLLPDFSAIGRWLAIGGAAGLILTQGRSQQGIIKKFLSGLLSLYNITGYLSDVLSYSRLLALGMATGVIAAAINSMGGMIAGSAVGTIIMIVVLFGGHLFNIIISTLGSYVHTSRLQYIEFFGKFFEGGGKGFEPFGMKTQYVDVIEAEEA
jgi:V/A-type H+/Na+-transporting ATPase subunit I